MSPAELEALIERVEKATGPDLEIDAAIALLSGWTHEKLNGDAKAYWREPGETQYFMRSSLPPFTASLDATVGLIERELPGAAFTLNCFDVARRPNRVRHNHAHLSDYGADSGKLGAGCGELGDGATPALALCAAFLRARLAEATR